MTRLAATILPSGGAWSATLSQTVSILQRYRTDAGCGDDKYKQSQYDSGSPEVRLPCVSYATRGAAGMISTNLGLSILNRDMKASLDRVASQASIKRDIEYYHEKIGQISSADEFLGDYRLYNVATKAFGLEDMAYAKAFIKQVLESDLNDTNSFANRLSDRRYRDFAAAFNFGSTSKTIETDVQEDELIGLYKQSYGNEETAAKTESDYYGKQIDKIQTVDKFLGDDRLRNFALKASGIDPTHVSKAFLKSLLTSDPNDPDSAINQASNAAYRKFAEAFNFGTDGKIDGATAQTATQKAAMIEDYNVTVPSFITKKAAEYNKAYYENTISSVKTVSELTADKRLFSYVKTAYGLNANMSSTEFKLIMGSNLDDPRSYANIVGAGAMVKSLIFPRTVHWRMAFFPRMPT